MRGLLLKTFRETWVSFLLFGLGLMLAISVLTYIIPQMQGSMGDIFESLPFVKTFLSAMIGTEVGDELTAQMMQAIQWVHPTVLAILWTSEIIHCTRMPAGEIDRGTADILFSLPVSRRTIYCSESLIWILGGIFILLMGFAGHQFTVNVWTDSIHPQVRIIVLILVNLFCVFLFVGGISYFVSSLCNVRGRALGILFAFVLISFLLNFLQQFWEPAKNLSSLNMMTYYQPAQILKSKAFPTNHVAFLVAVGGFFWIAGCEILARRNITTV